MPLTTETKILELKDVKLSALTADPEGGSATYGTPVDIPGVIKLGITPQMTTKELKGDNKLLDLWAKVDRLQWSLDHARLSFDALKAMMGGTITAAGVTPNQTQTFSLGKDDTPGYFKLEGQAVYTDAGDTHVVLFKCKATEPPKFEMSGEDFATVSVSGIALALESTGKIFDVIINETKTDIA